MTEPLSNNILRFFRNRNAMLWNCQRYDLAEGAAAHDYSLPPGEAALRYRTGTTAADRAFASYHWEAIWTESARSAIVNLLRASPGSRQVVVLSGAADAAASVASGEFLPVAVLPGLLDGSGPPDGRYGETKPRIRSRIADELARRIENYTGRLLVVLGAETQDDLKRLYETLESTRVADLHVLIVWPTTIPLPPAPDAPVTCFFWQGSLTEFAQALIAAEIPLASDSPKWSILVGRRSLQFEAREIQRALKRFAILTEKDLLPPGSLDMADVQEFLEGSVSNWSAFSCGLPAPRAYRSESDLTLEEEVKESFRTLREVSESLTAVVEVPCEAGSGATSLLRSIAFSAARDGHPTLVLRPDQVDIDIEELLAFATALHDTANSLGVKDVPAMLVVSDVEHEHISELRTLPQAFAAAGRSALILRAVRYEPSDEKRKSSSRFKRLKPLLSGTTDQEVVGCREAFERIASRFSLPLTVPSIDDWKGYEKAAAFSSRGGAADPSSLFWVALRFFLIEGLDLGRRASALDALGEWIEKRVARVASDRARHVLGFVAALSSLD